MSGVPLNGLSYWFSLGVFLVFATIQKSKSKNFFLLYNYFRHDNPEKAQNHKVSFYWSNC